MTGTGFGMDMTMGKETKIVDENAALEGRWDSGSAWLVMGMDVGAI